MDLFHLEDFDPLDADDDLEGIFGDIVNTVGKIAAAPVNLVASALPKPIGKAVKTVAGVAMPTTLLDRGVRSATVSTAGKVLSGGGRVAGQVAARAPVRATASGRVSGGGQVTNSDVLDTLVRVLGANAVVKNIKPKVTAKSTGKGAADAQAALLAKAVRQQIAPELAAINKKLNLAANQRTATSEHNAINNQAAFRRKVLQDLMRISACLPEGNPTKERIRRIGLMSGLL